MSSGSSLKARGALSDFKLAETYSNFQGRDPYQLDRSTSRYLIDLQVVPAAKEMTHLPIIVDPSHSTFKRSYVPAVARAACAIGADGLIIDVHPDPEKAAVDPLNAITYDVFENLMRELSIISKVVKKNIG